MLGQVLRREEPAKRHLMKRCQVKRWGGIPTPSLENAILNVGREVNCASIKELQQQSELFDSDLYHRVG